MRKIVYLINCSLSEIPCLTHFVGGDSYNNDIGRENTKTLSLLERAIMNTPENESRIRGFEMPCDAEVLF